MTPEEIRSQAGRQLEAQRPRGPRTCDDCGTPYIGREGSRFCSRTCYNRVKKRNHRARQMLVAAAQH